MDNSNQPTYNSVTFHEAIMRSKDQPFFIRYTPEDTIIRQWYFIQVDVESSLSLHAEYDKV